MVSVAQEIAWAAQFITDRARTEAKTLVTPVHNVKGYGASGNGIVDDTASIQAAVDAASQDGGTVFVPPGTYLINTLTSLLMRDNTILYMAPGVILKAIPNGADNYEMIKATNVSGVRIIGGILIGDRFEHQGTTGQWGLGISIKGARDVSVEGVYAKDFWGDGIYIANSDANGESRDIRVSGCILDNNRRQGISIVACIGAVIEGCVFRNTNGHAPRSGIDVEPNAPFVCQDIKIVGCHAYGNAGNGFQTWNADNVVISGCTATGNGSVNGAGIQVYGGKGHTITGNMLRSNNKSNIQIVNTSDVTVSGNTCVGSAEHGIYVQSSTGVNVVGNTVASNDGAGIFVEQTTYSRVGGNVVRQNGQAGIQLYMNSSHNIVDGNMVAENNQKGGGYDNITTTSSSTYNTITTNVCRRGDLANKPQYAIDIRSDNNLVTGNDCFEGGTDSGINLVGSGTVLGAGNRNNAGAWVTQGG